jgi:hypothetical protein
MGNGELGKKINRRGHGVTRRTLPDNKFQCHLCASLTYIIIYDIDIAIKVSKENIMKKYFYFIILLLTLSLSGCFFIPCKTTLSIENLSSNAKIMIIDYEKKVIENNIQDGENLFYNNKIMKNIKYVYIKSETIEGVFILLEYDHMFARDHNIKIIIRTNDFEINGEGKKINSEVSYKWEAEKVFYRRDEASNKVIEESIDPETIFETIKKQRYEEIYDIIKN